MPELRGDRVLLRAGRHDDLDGLEAMFATPEVDRWWRIDDRDDVVAEVIDDRSDEDVTPFVIEVDGEVVGVIQAWEETDEEYRHAGMDIAVHPSWHGTGVALDALRTLARHLIDDRGHHRITIDPNADNERAIAAYAKLGFKPVGIMRRYERARDGTWHDGLLMDLLADELT